MELSITGTVLLDALIYCGVVVLAFLSYLNIAESRRLGKSTTSAPEGNPTSTPVLTQKFYSSDGNETILEIQSAVSHLMQLRHQMAELQSQLGTIDRATVATNANVISLQDLAIRQMLQASQNRDEYRTIFIRSSIVNTENSHE